MISNKNFNTQINGLRSQEIIKSSLVGNIKGNRRNIVTRNDIQLGTVAEGSSTVLQGQTNSYEQDQIKQNRFKTRHESGQGVIATDHPIQDSLRNSRNNLPKVGSLHPQAEETDQMVHQFASFGSSSSIQYQQEVVYREAKNRKDNFSNRSIVPNQGIQKQKSHIVLSPLNKDSDNQINRIAPNQRGMGSIQLRSARNLPELKSQAKSP